VLLPVHVVQVADELGHAATNDILEIRVQQGWF
jgi:hypothetical protein